jgi:NitT/TauT family transport system substrate-binding protein
MFGSFGARARASGFMTVAIVLSAGALAACGSNSNNTAGGAVGGATSASSGGSSSGGSGGGKLTTVTVGTPNTAFSPQSINFEIPGFLGYYKQQGLSVKFENLGTPEAVNSALATGKVDFAIMPDTSITSTVAQGQSIGGKAFYEFAYPFKYGVAVNPDSKVTSLAQLKGTTVGTDSFGQSEYEVGQVLLQNAGVSKSDVHWLETGVGVASGEALQRNRISALFYSDAGYGEILAAGIKMRFLPLGNNVPQIGGQMVVASDKVWNGDRSLATKLATAIGETSVFTLANPTAASYAFLKEFPTAAPPGESLTKQIALVELGVKLRDKLFDPPSGLKLGQVNPQNFKDAVSFQKLKPVNVGSLYSNAVIPAANKFSVAKVKAQAKKYKVPGISGQVSVANIPAGTP